jgi:hypothetical protein
MSVASVESATVYYKSKNIAQTCDRSQRLSLLRNIPEIYIKIGYHSSQHQPLACRPPKAADTLHAGRNMQGLAINLSTLRISVVATVPTFFESPQHKQMNDSCNRGITNTATKVFGFVSRCMHQRMLGGSAIQDLQRVSNRRRSSNP